MDDNTTIVIVFGMVVAFCAYLAKLIKDIKNK